MPVRYDRTARTYYDDVTGEDILRDDPRLEFATWHNPDGTSNDIP